MLHVYITVDGWNQFPLQLVLNTSPILGRTSAVSFFYPILCLWIISCVLAFMPTLAYLCPCIHLYTCTRMLLISVWPKMLYELVPVSFFLCRISIFLVPPALFFLHFTPWCTCIRYTSVYLYLYALFTPSAG